MARGAFWNAVLIRESISKYDLLAISIPAMIMSVFVSPSRKRWRQAVFLVAAVAIFASGFLPLLWEERYTRAFFFPLFCLLSFGLAGDWLRRLHARTEIRRWQHWAVAPLLFVSYLLPSVYMYSKEPWNSVIGRRCKAVAVQLKSLECAGPIAILPSESLTYHYGLYTAFYADLRYAGGVKGTDIRQMEKDLADYGVETLLLDPHDPHGNWFLNGTSWTHKAFLIGPKGIPKIAVLVAPKTSPKQQGRQW